MDVTRRPVAAAAACLLSLVAAACGSNSGPPSAATAPAAGSNRVTRTSGASSGARPAPPTLSTRSAPGRPNAGASSSTAAFTRTVLPDSTPIGSAQYHDAVVDAVEKAGKAPKTAQAIANCIQQVLHNAGIATVGDADAVKRNPTGNKQVANGALQCLASAAP